MSLKSTLIMVYSNEKINISLPEGDTRVQYANPRFFQKPNWQANYVWTDNSEIANAYKKQGTKLHEDSPLSEQPVQQPPQPPTPTEPLEPEPAPADPQPSTPETVQKETDHLTHDEIRSAPFFTQKKMVKEKYGVVAKNKEEIEAVLADNE